MSPLATARAILADCTQHRDTEIYSAALEVLATSTDIPEREDAQNMANLIMRTGGEWLDCWNCAGDGDHPNPCACAYEVDYCTCPVTAPCAICDGHGGWHELRSKRAEAAHDA